MPGGARLFSEFIAETPERHSTSTRANNVNIPDSVQVTKRRKTAGLNSKFDRMVETISVMRRPQVKYGRQRTPSASSSFVSSHGPPKTPVDAYSGLQKGNLGESFSLIKMDSSSGLRTNASWRERDTSGSIREGDGPSVVHQSKVPMPRSPLPEWLATTFTTLNAQHPLRMLLPSPSHHTIGVVTPDSVDWPEPLIPQKPSDGAEDSVFAFHPLTEQVVAEDPAHHNHETAGLEFEPHPSWPQRRSIPLVHMPDSTSPPLPLPLNRPESRHTSSAFNIDSQSANILPFSTPGPGSSVSQLILSSSDSHSSPPENFKFSSVQPALDWSSFSPAVHSRALPTIPRPADPAATHSSDDTPIDYPSDEDIATDDSLSDPFLQTAHTSSHLFSTPGPVYHISRAIYFDSPTEDPADSDPSQLAYDLDHDTLDFHWKPFIRNGVDAEGTANISNTPDQSKISSRANSLVISQSYQPDTTHNVNTDEITGQLPANHFDSLNLNGSFPFTSSPKHLISPNPFRFAPPTDNTVLGYAALLLPATEPYDDDSEGCHPTPDPQPMAPSFAPAPGIFISPLRNPQSSQMGDQVGEQNSQDTKPGRLGILDLKSRPNQKGRKIQHDFFLDSHIHEQVSETQTCSQVSNDSIKSWQDADV